MSSDNSFHHIRKLDSALNQRRRFTNILSDVTNVIRDENDSKVAKSIQRNEVQSMANEWVTETIDRRIAIKLQEQISSDEKKHEESKVKAGESLALQIAIEERRRIKQIAEEKKEIERMDAELAKRTSKFKNSNNKRAILLTLLLSLFSQQYWKKLITTIRWLNFVLMTATMRSKLRKRCRMSCMLKRLTREKRKKQKKLRHIWKSLVKLTKKWHMIYKK